MPTRDHEQAAQQRRGVLLGFAAYSLWGAFPLVFHRLRDVPSAEVLMHRITWSFVLVASIMALRRDWSWWTAIRTPGASRRRLLAAAALISVNWLVYVWAVAQDRVVEAALGYYVNPLITVALGVALLKEPLSRAQIVALALAVTAVVVLTIALGQVPWVSLVLAFSFAGYGYLKKSVAMPALRTLAVETAVLLPFALVGLVVMQVRGDAAFAHGSPGQDLLLVSLGAVTATPLLLFAASARRVPLVLIGLLQYLTPTVQLILGVTVLGEHLSGERLVGFVLVWVALVVLGVDAARSARAARSTRRDRRASETMGAA